MRTTADALRAVRAVLERDGWKRNSIGTADGPKCLVGACYAVVGGHFDLPLPEDFTEYDAVFGVLMDEVQPWPTVAYWNDQCDSVDQVYALIDRAVARLESKP